MKVLMVLGSKNVTGAFKSMLILAKDLRNEFEFEFVIPKEEEIGNLIQAEGLRFHSIDFAEIRKNFWAMLSYIPRLLLNGYSLKKLVEKRRIDIVHVEDINNLAAASAKVLGGKFKLLTHNRRIPDPYPQLVFQLWKRISIKFSDIVVAVSHANKKGMDNHSKVVVIYNKVDIEESYQKFEKPSGSNVSFLYMANYIEGKGHEHALEAFELALKENSMMELTFAGSDMGLSKNRLRKKDLIKLAVEKGLSKQVKFRGKIIDVEREMKSHDVVLNFSDFESFSRVSLEALGYGRPLIATDVGGTSEMIKTGQNGILVPKGDTEAMKTQILFLASNQGEREKLSQNAYRLVREKFGYDQTSKKIKNLYQLLK